MFCLQGFYGKFSTKATPTRKGLAFRVRRDYVRQFPIGKFYLSYSRTPHIIGERFQPNEDVPRRVGCCLAGLSGTAIRQNDRRNDREKQKQTHQYICSVRRASSPPRHRQDYTLLKKAIVTLAKMVLTAVAVTGTNVLLTNIAMASVI